MHSPTLSPLATTTADGKSSGGAAVPAAPATAASSVASSAWAVRARKGPVRYTPLQISSSTTGTPRRAAAACSAAAVRGCSAAKRAKCCCASSTTATTAASPASCRAKAASTCAALASGARYAASKSHSASRRGCARKTADALKAARVQLPWKEPSNSTSISGGPPAGAGWSAPPGRGAQSASASAWSIASAPECSPRTAWNSGPSPEFRRSTSDSSSAASHLASGSRMGVRAARHACSAPTASGGEWPKMAHPAFWLRSRTVRSRPLQGDVNRRWAP